MQGSSYATAPKVLKTFLETLVIDVVDTCARMDAKLTSVLLHGSLAMGCFYIPKSDIDILVIVDDLPESQSDAFYNLFKRHHDKRPYVGGLEASVIRRREAQNPTHPMPLLTYFNEQTPDPPRRVAGELLRSETLLMNAAVARTRGVALWGPAPEVALGEVRWSDYLRAVENDMAEVLGGEAILRSPFLAVLNLCRWQMIRRTPDRVVPSKEEAGLWALEHLPPETWGIIAQALAAYRASGWPRDAHERRRAGGPWDRSELLKFRAVLRTLA